MEKSLRDELAMSLDSSLIPKLQSEAVIKKVADELGLEYDLNDTLKMIEFTFKYHSILRYQYADEMLMVRGVK